MFVYVNWCLFSSNVDKNYINTRIDCIFINYNDHEVMIIHENLYDLIILHACVYVNGYLAS